MQHDFMSVSADEAPHYVLVMVAINPLVPRVQKIKIRNSTVNWLLIADFVKKIVYFGAHYSERQGLMG